jgi:capsular polysaccharide biosynthesis protein
MDDAIRESRRYNMILALPLAIVGLFVIAFLPRLFDA